MKTIAFTTCDANNEKYAVMLEKSFKKFHPDIELKVIKGEELGRYLKDDPSFFYRQKPVLMEKFFNEGYELVIGLDSDQIVCGDLNEMLESKYDVAVVHNWNRTDPKMYGEVGLATIVPQEYFNCGLVAVQSPEFVKQWKKLCFSHHFDRMPYREQGFLNLLAHYSNFNVKDLDVGGSFYGLASKGEWDKCVMKEGKVVLPASDYLLADKFIKIIHWAGGNSPIKMNYRVYFSEECSNYLDNLVS